MVILWSMACRALSVTVSDAYTPLDGPKGAVFIVEFMYPAAATWHMKFLHHCLLCIEPLPYTEFGVMLTSFIQANWPPLMNSVIFTSPLFPSSSTAAASMASSALLSVISTTSLKHTSQHLVKAVA